MTTTSLLPATTFNNGQVSNIVTKKGKVAGARVIFGGTERASDVRVALKAANPTMTAKELKLAVNDVLTGKNTVAWAEMQVAIEGMRSAGYTPDYADVRKSGGVVRFIKPTAPKESKTSVALAAALAKIAELEAMMKA